MPLLRMASVRLTPATIPMLDSFDTYFPSFGE